MAEAKFPRPEDFVEVLDPDGQLELNRDLAGTLVVGTSEKPLVITIGKDTKTSKRIEIIGTIGVTLKETKTTSYRSCEETLQSKSAAAIEVITSVIGADTKSKSNVTDILKSLNAG